MRRATLVDDGVHELGGGGWEGHGFNIGGVLPCGCYDREGVQRFTVLLLEKYEDAGVGCIDNAKYVPGKLLSISYLRSAILRSLVVGVPARVEG